MSEESSSVSGPVASAPGFLGRGPVASAPGFRAALPRVGFGLVSGLLLLATALAGCGPGVKKTPPPTLAESIREFRVIAESEYGRMLVDPARAADALAIFKEGIEARSRSYGEPFTTYLTTVNEVEASWSGKPTTAAVKQGVATLREALTRLDESQKR